MTASVIVPTRNKADRLRMTLRGLGRAGSVPHEVIVVDDGCTDGTGAVLAEAAAAGLPIRVVTGPRRGRAAARNAGAAEASGRLLIFLDDDILVGPGFVAAHLRAHDAGGGIPIGDTGPGQPAVVHGPLRELPMAGRLVAAAPPDPYGRATDRTFGRTVVNALERLILAMAQRSAPPVAPWLASVGANLSLPASGWRDAGGFDEGFGATWGCEDLEFGYRLLAGGAAMRVAPEADGVHLTHVRPDRWEQHAVNLDRFLTLHPDPAVAALSELLASNGSPARYLQAARPAATAPESV